MLIKVCGIAEAENARQVAGLLPEMMGFIFYRPSPRNAFGLSPEAVLCLPPEIKRVGVFVDKTEENVVQTVQTYGLDFVQLHGNETPDFCYNIKGKVPGIIKAFGIESVADLDPIRDYEGLCGLYVFDTKTPSRGGSGIKFDHSILRNYRGSTPFLLSGGIGPQNIDIFENPHPLCAGADLNSLFEKSPGIKDTGLLKNFIDRVKNQHI